jgi:hypothetical protein
MKGQMISLFVGISVSLVLVVIIESLIRGASVGVVGV